jgi:sporulation protein YqfC
LCGIKILPGELQAQNEPQGFIGFCFDVARRSPKLAGEVFMRWRELQRQLRRKTAAALDLPGEVAFNLPKIVITGNVQVLIENHRGIVSYGREEVRLLVEAGEVAVSGRGLVIRSIVPEEIVIEGEIQGVRFV